MFGRFAKIQTVGHKEKRIVQLDDEEEMGEREGKDATHDFSPKPAMVREQFWQERTSKEVATRRSAKSAFRRDFGYPDDMDI